MTIEERSDAAHCWTRQYREAFAAIGGEAVVEILRPYLEDEDFGFDAGWVLQEIWQRQQNEPPPDPLKAWPDFADVRARREQRRAATELDPASPIAEMSTACSLSDISGWRAGVLYPLAGGGRESGAAHLDLQTDPHPPSGWCSGCRPHDGDVAGGAGFLFRDIAVRGDDGARAIGATDAAAAVELPGRRRRPP
jgi:hypothetical protein